MSATIKWSTPRSPGIMGVLVVLVSQLLGGAIVLLALGNPDGPEVAWAGVAGSLVGLLVALGLVARERRVPLLRTVSAILPNREELRGMTGTYLALLAALGYAIALSYLVEIPNTYSPVIYQAALSPIMWVDGILLAPIVEELVFRGFLFDAMLKRGPMAAVVLSAIVGALMHIHPAQVLGVLPMQAVLGYARFRTNGVGVCVVLHILHNLLAVLVALCLAILVTP